MPKVWNKRDPNCPKDAVYVGRPTRWGNPFTVAQLGRVEALNQYNMWIRTTDKLKLEDFKELKGKDLACWCAPKACHADIILRIAND